MYFEDGKPEHLASDDWRLDNDFEKEEIGAATNTAPASTPATLPAAPVEAPEVPARR